MTRDIESAARVSVDPDLLNLALYAYVELDDGPEEQWTYSNIAATAFARWSGKPPTRHNEDDEALLDALVMRLWAFSRLIEADEGPRLLVGDGPAWRRAVAVALAGAELMGLDGAPTFRIEDVLARLDRRPAP